MEIIKINENAIKVIFDKEECLNYDFIIDADLTERETTDSLNLLLCVIKEKTGIDMADRGLLVQVYIGNDDVSEIYICSTEGDEMYKDRVVPQSTKRISAIKSVFRFDSLEIMLSACKRLNTITCEGSSEVYYDEDKGKYYLVCQNISSKELRYSFMNEYSKQLKSPSFYYIKEHLKCLCNNNAISIFSNLA